MATDFSKIDFTSKVGSTKVATPPTKYTYQPLTPTAFKQTGKTSPSRMFSTNIVKRTEDFAKTPQGTFALSAADALLMGIPSGLDKKVGITKNIEAMSEHPMAQLTGTLAGSLLPFGAADKALKGIKALGGMTLAPRIARNAISGGAVMGVQGLIQGETPEEIGWDVLGGTIFGIGADLGLSTIGKYAGLAMRNVAKKLGTKPEDIAQSIASGDEEVINIVKQENQNIDSTIQENPNMVSETIAPEVTQGVKVDGKKAKPIRVATMSAKDVQRAEDLLKKQESISGGDALASGRDKIIETKIPSFIDKVKSKLSSSNIDKVSEDFMKNWVDRLTSFKRLEKGITGKISSIENSLYKTARSFAHIPMQAFGRVEYGLKPIIKSIEDNGFTVKDLDDYAAAVHAKDVNNLGIDSGLTNEEINAIINHFGKSQVMEDARLALLKYNDDLIQELANSGRISQDQLNAMRKKYPNYVPLHREMDMVEKEFGFFPKEKFSNPRMPIKAMKGSERNITSPLESIIANTYEILTASGQAQVGKQLKMLADNDVAETFIRRIKDGEKTKGKNVVTIFDNGKEIEYEVDENVFRAMNGLGQQATHLIAKILGQPASWLRAGATLTPEFAVRNPMRDIIQAYITTGFNPVTDFARGILSYARKDDLYKRFLESKGGYGNITSMDRNTNRKILNDFVKKPISGKFISIINPKSYLELLRSISDFTETSTKLGMFKKGVREGLSDAESAFQAADLMDFTMAGDTAKELNKVSAFFNSSIQGKYKIIRAIKENPKAVTARMFKALVLPAITVKALQYTTANDEQMAQINDAPDWMKDSFYLIPVPNTNFIARIPKPFDLAVVANVTERAMDYMYQNDPTAFEGLALDTIKQLTPNVFPTGIVPIAEAFSSDAGYSFFRGTSIVPLREQTLPQEMQQDVYTSELAKTIAGGARALPVKTNLGSPRIVENTIKGYTAGLGQYGMDVYDFIAGKTYAKDAKKPSKTLPQQPLVRAFLVNDMSTGKSTTFVYDKYKELNTKNTGLKQQGKELVGEEKKMFDDLSNYKEAIANISKDMRDIQNSLEFAPNEKRDELKQLNDERNSFAREAYDKYKRNDKPTIPFYSKYNLTDKQTENLKLIKGESGLSEEQIVRGYSKISGLKTTEEKYNAIMSLPYSEEIKSRLLQII